MRIVAYFLLFTGIFVHTISHAQNNLEAAFEASLLLDIKAKVATITEPRYVFNWMSEDELSGSGTSHAAIHQRLIDRFKNHSQAYWGYSQNTYNGSGGPGVYGALDLILSSGYGYDGSDRWIAAWILIPRGTRIFNIDSNNASNRTVELAYNIGCPTDYRAMMNNPFCFKILKNILRKLQISGITYGFNSVEVCKATDRCQFLALVLFNEALFSDSTVLHYSGRDQYHWNIFTEEQRYQMALLSDLMEVQNGYQIWPKIKKQLASYSVSEQERAKELNKICLGCSDAYKEIWHHLGNFSIPAFPLNNTKLLYPPRIAVRGLYENNVVIHQATYGNQETKKPSVRSIVDEIMPHCNHSGCAANISDIPYISTNATFDIEVKYQCIYVLFPINKSEKWSLGYYRSFSFSCPKFSVLNILSITIQTNPIPIVKGNVTALVQNYFLRRPNSNALEIYGEYLGDPSPGESKSFDMYYSCPEAPEAVRHLSVIGNAENTIVQLKCKDREQT